MVSASKKLLLAVTAYVCQSPNFRVVIGPVLTVLWCV